MESNDQRLVHDVCAAFEGLHASDSLYEDVLRRVQQPHMRGRGSALPLAVVIAIACGLALVGGGTAYAIVQSDFFQRAWGDHGTGDVFAPADDSVTGSVDVYQQRGGSLPSGLVYSLEEATEEVDLSVSTHGYTLTVGSFVMDDTGTGAVSFTLENPDGLGFDYRYGMPAELTVNGDGPGLEMVSMKSVLPTDEANHLNVRTYYEKESVTDTALSGTMYFNVFGGDVDVVRAGICWRLVGYDGTAEEPQYYEETTDTFTPKKMVESHVFTSDDGSIARVSPYGMWFHIEGSGRGGAEFNASHIALVMDDGTEFVIESSLDDSYCMNWYMASVGDDGSVSLSSTRLIDVDHVASVRIVGKTLDGDDEEREIRLTPL